jgi:serralysin
MARIDGGWGFTYWQNDRLFGTSVADEIRANGGNDQVFAGGGSDRVWMGEGHDTAFGGTGHDTIFGEDGNDELNGDGGNDQLFGGNGRDTLNGGADNDRLFGGADDDVLNGDSGNDVLDGGWGDDRMFGGIGDDVFTDALGNNVINGGTDADGMDVDTIDYSGFYGKVSVNLATGAGSMFERWVEIVNQDAGTSVVHFDRVGTATISNIERVDGTSYNDTLTGGSRNETFIGNAGQDQIRGGGGADTLSGGPDLDTLTGGEGKDVFLFNTAIRGSGNQDRDLIRDFAPIDDTLQFENAIFTGLGAAGPLAAGALRITDGFVNRSTAALDADDRFVYSTLAGDLYYDGDGAGGADAVWVARLENRPMLTAADFVII